MRTKHTNARKVAPHRRVLRHIHLWTVPHRDNQYHPHLIRSYGLLLLAVLVIGIQLSYNFVRTGHVLGQTTVVTPVGLLVDTNDKRVESGIAPLELDARLTEAAQAKAQDMITNQYWAHTSPSGVEPWRWIDESGYRYTDAGENLAKDFTSARATVAAWMDSPEHRETMLSADYRDVGFAAVSGELGRRPTTIVVALYATSASAVLGAQQTSAAALNYQLTPADRIGVALQSLTPAAITSLALIFVAATVAITAQIYRHKLPKIQRESWYRHHGALKATGLLSAAAIIVLLYGGGQI